MLSFFLRQNSFILGKSSINLLLLQRTKTLIGSRPLQTFSTNCIFSKKFEKAIIMPRGRPSKAKAKNGTAAAEKKVVAKKTKRADSEDESDTENGSTLTEKKVVPKKTKRPDSEDESDSENGTTEKKAAPKKTKHSSDSEDENDSESETDQPAKKKAKPEPKPMMNKTDTNLDEINFGCEKLNIDGEKHNIKICAWNISGIRAVLKKSGMEYLKREAADIIALQETKCETKKIPDEVKLKGYKHYFLDSKKPGYCGIALYSKKEPLNVSYGLNNEEFDIEGRLITAEYDKFYLVNVYVPNAGQKLKTMPKRLGWNEAFKKHILDLNEKKPVVICGDMNVAHKEIDLTNPKTNTKNAGFTQEERDGMTDFLNAGFVDAFRLLYPEKTGVYTFWSYFNNARGRNIGWRLDYYIVSEKIKNKVCDVVNRDQVFGSDHCPIVFYANL